MASTANEERPSPFEEDALVCSLSERHGLEIIRTEAITVTDEASLKRQGLMRSTPDYPKIRRLLNSGIPVVGAERGDYEYILRRPKRKEANADQNPADK